MPSPPASPQHSTTVWATTKGEKQCIIDAPDSRWTSVKMTYWRGGGGQKMAGQSSWTVLQQLSQGCCSIPERAVVRRGVLDLEAFYIRLTSVLHPSYIRLTCVLHASYIRLM